MVEVFITNVKENTAAIRLLDEIHRRFIHYKANFDLDDRDKILRVASEAGSIQKDQLIKLVMEKGFHAEILPDELPSPEHLLIPPENFQNEYN
jgi:hypothetical protein